MEIGSVESLYFGVIVCSNMIDNAKQISFLA